MKENIIGVDIGGTKCAVTYGQQEGNRVTILDKECFRTSDVTRTIEQLKTCIRNVMRRHGLDAGNTRAIGISCGGPLDSRTGVVMSPPNLPGWDNIPIVGIFEKEFGIRTAIHNDANACALAEWQFGAGAGTRNMIFLTFGTGLGAGLILDGRIYTGTNDNAGELGHIRLSDFGPVGYGKCGSFEGFCSGGGIRQLAETLALRERQKGAPVSMGSGPLTARVVAEAAGRGDPLALEALDHVARQLGRGLALLVDLLNPERIVIGSIYARCEGLLRDGMLRTLAQEALPASLAACRILPAALGDRIGDYAALAIAMAGVEQA